MQPKTIFIALLMFVISGKNHVFSQIQQSPKGVNLSVSGGSSVFFGDIKQYPLLPALSNRSELRYVALLDIEDRFTEAAGMRLQLAYSHVLGTNRTKDVHFQSFVYETNAAFMFYPVNAFAGYKGSRFADFYLVAGVGLTQYNAKLYQLSTGFELASKGFGKGKGIGGTEITPLGLAGFGIDFPLNPRVNLRFETAQRILGTDELDITKGDFNYDMYNYTTFGLTFKLGNRSTASTVPDSRKTTPQREVQELPAKNEWQPINQVIEVEKPAAEVVKTDPEPVVTTPPVTETEKPAPDSLPTPIIIPDFEYRIQIFAAGQKPVSIETLAKRFNINASEIRENRFNGMYVYSVGSHQTYNQAAAARDQIRTKVRDAFIVAYENGERLSKLPVR